MHYVVVRYSSPSEHYSHIVHKHKSGSVPPGKHCESSTRKVHNRSKQHNYVGLPRITTVRMTKAKEGEK